MLKFPKFIFQIALLLIASQITQQTTNYLKQIQNKLDRQEINLSQLPEFVKNFSDIEVGNRYQLVFYIKMVTIIDEIQTSPAFIVTTNDEQLSEMTYLAKKQAILNHQQIQNSEYNYSSISRRLLTHIIRIDLEQKEYKIHYLDLKKSLEDPLPAIQDVKIALEVKLEARTQKEDIKPYQCSIPTPENDIFSYGKNCSQNVQLLAENYKYSFNVQQSYVWTSFAFKVRKGYEYKLKIVNLGENTVVHTGFINSTSLNEIEDPNFLENSLITNKESGNEVYMNINLDRQNKYLEECQQNESYQECMSTKMATISFFITDLGPYTNEQGFSIRSSDIELREVAIISGSFYYFLALILGLLILFVFGSTFVYIYFKEKKNSTNNSENSSQNQNQQNSETQVDNTLSKKIVHVIITQNTVEKFMPQRTHKELTENMPEIKEQKECFICLNEFQPEETCRMTVCLHVFHISCVDYWIKNYGSCPYCRAKINRKLLEDTESRKKVISQNPFMKKIIDSQVSSVINNEEKPNSSQKRMKEFDFMYDEYEQSQMEKSLNNDLKQSEKTSAKTLKKQDSINNESNQQENNNNNESNNDQQILNILNNEENSHNMSSSRNQDNIHLLIDDNQSTQQSNSPQHTILDTQSSDQV